MIQRSDCEHQIVNAINKRDIRLLKRLETKLLQETQKMLGSIHKAAEAIASLEVIDKAKKERAIIKAHEKE